MSDLPSLRLLERKGLLKIFSVSFGGGGGFMSRK